ncbi:DUF4253 domain-containing protein [Kitasatospora sp. NPDC007106]|uniref:DUF4253 domain-containing protein n=1 Tax=Kitasatospora sp. NPDC007106 TaxID=3156914 RepID=UPI0033C5CD8F
MTSIEAHDVDALLRDWWQGVAECRSDDPEEAAERRAATAPFGPAWPGRAPSPTPASDPGVHASRLAARLLSERPTLRIGLVPAACGAEALVACGWSGPMNHENDTATIAAVLHGWERRFGVRVVAAGFDTLDLAVAAPPTDLDGALLVAAEHLALCPDNILQGTGSLAEYAEHLIAADTWTLWWD